MLVEKLKEDKMGKKKKLEMVDHEQTKVMEEKEESRKKGAERKITLESTKEQLQTSQEELQSLKVSLFSHSKRTFRKVHFKLLNLSVSVRKLFSLLQFSILEIVGRNFVVVHMGVH